MAAVGALTVGAVLRKRHKKEKGALLSANNKLSDNYQLLNHWLEVKNEGKSLAGYFLEMGYSRIAIYGMAELANRLTEDLAGSGVEIVYGIDRDAGCSISRIAEVYSPQEDSLPEVDAVIVTPYYALEAIKKNLSGKVACPVVSIEEVVWSV
nr:hypothetical protein [uncultured Acetatifactor sp.]